MLLNLDILAIILEFDKKGFEEQNLSTIKTIEQSIFEALRSAKFLLKDDQIQHLDYSYTEKTETKVSASGNVIALKLRVKNCKCENILKNLNFYLPNDIIIFSIVEVPEDFNAVNDC